MFIHKATCNKQEHDRGGRLLVSHVLRWPSCWLLAPSWTQTTQTNTLRCQRPCFNHPAPSLVTVTQISSLEVFSLTLALALGLMLTASYKPSEAFRSRVMMRRLSRKAFRKNKTESGDICPPEDYTCTEEVWKEFDSHFLVCRCFRRVCVHSRWDIKYTFKFHIDFLAPTHPLCLQICPVGHYLS